jgi:DNA-3-methyladenine glycosylase II
MIFSENRLLIFGIVRRPWQIDRRATLIDQVSARRRIRIDRDPTASGRIMVYIFEWRVIFSEKRYPLFRIMLSTIRQPDVVMPSHIHTEADLDAALTALGEADPRFAALVAKAGRPPLRRRGDGFAGLAAIIVAQQLSTASANAILARLTAAFDPLDPAAIVRARPARLRRLGLSAAKVRTLKAIARATLTEELALAALADLPADEAHAALTAVHGIGPWTADIYLLSALGHADAWPAGDLALQQAAKVAFALPARPTAKEMLALAEPWRPWRAVAARVLWSYYRAVADAVKTAAAKPPKPAQSQAAAPGSPPRPKRRASSRKIRRKTRNRRASAPAR